MVDGAIRRRVSGDGVELAALEAGDGAGPTVVLVHGYPDNKEVWDGVVARLAGRFHVVAYDVRGAGASTAPKGRAAYDFEKLGDDLLAVIESLVPGDDVHLVGHDWGAIAGWEFATQPRFEGKLASFTAIAGPSLDQVGLASAKLLHQGRLLEWAMRARRSWYVLALCAPGGPALASRLLGPDALHGSNLYRRNIPRRMRRPRRDAIAHVPVQLIVPSEDRFITAKHYEDAERFAPRLRRRAIAGSHWVPRTRPELIARWIESFVDDVLAGAPAAIDPLPI
jgi:pimeloyl-ACP methyl ester carboxylesterase